MAFILPDPAPCVFPAISQAERRSVPLTFQPAGDANADWLRGVWKDMANAARKAHSLAGVPVPRWLNWQPWQWCYEKAALDAGRTPVLAWADGWLVGLLTLWPVREGDGLLYVEHMGVTPGDIRTPLWNRRYHMVGWSLFAYAIHVSRANGFAGRVGLHAESDAVKVGVYDKYEQAVPGLFRPAVKGVPGPTPYGPHKNLALDYLETTDTGSERFLENFRHA